MPDRAGRFFQGAAQEPFFQDEKGREIEAPKQEIPAGAMPDAGGGPDDQQVQEEPGLGHPVSPQRNIEILPEPGSQRDVPPPPEFGDGLGDIRVVKVTHKFKAQHPPQPYSHIGITGKIKVDLERKGDDAQPCTCSGELLGRHGLVSIPQHSQVIGQEHLLGQSDYKDLHTRGKLLHLVISVVDLVVQVLVFDDGAGDELRKEGHKGTKADDTSLGSGVSTVDINGIAHGLEGIEGDADGKAQPQYRHKPKTNSGQASGDKVPVFEEKQKGQVKDYGRCHRAFCSLAVAPLFILVHQQAVRVVNGDRDKHDKNIYRFTPSIEDQV